MPRRTGGSTYKVCKGRGGCGQRKLAQRDYAPRWGRCARHKHLKYKVPNHDPNCRECVGLRNGPTRQPLCFPCDDARKERLGIEAALRRTVRHSALDPDATIKPLDSSVLKVMVYGLGLAADPSALATELRRLAAGKVELEIEPFLVGDTQSELLEPLIYDEPPRGSRTHVPVFDLTATAGGLVAPGSTRIEGYVDAGARALRDDFAMRVRGRSMIPLIQPRSLCVFRPVDFGTHLNGTVVLAQGREELDPEEGGRLTVKRLVLPNGRDTELRLEPVNRDYEPIIVGEGDDVRIIAQYLRVVRSA